MLNFQFPFVWRSRTPRVHLDEWRCRMLGVSENPDKIPEHKRRICTNVQGKVANDVRGDKGSPKDCLCLKSCESFYTCPHAPFYMETKGPLHSDNTLELKEYS
jgi:hypothetical protein